MSNKLFNAHGKILNDPKLPPLVNLIKQWYVKYEAEYIPLWSGELKKNKKFSPYATELKITYTVEYAEDAYNSIYFGKKRHPSQLTQKKASAYWDRKIDNHMRELEERLENVIEQQLEIGG